MLNAYTFWYKSRYLTCFGMSHAQIGTKNIVFYDSKTCEWHKSKYKMRLRVGLHKGIKMKGNLYFFAWAGYPHFKISFGENYLFQQFQQSWKVERLIWICYYKERCSRQSKLHLNRFQRCISHTFRTLRNAKHDHEQTKKGILTLNGYWIGKLPKCC